MNDAKEYWKAQLSAGQDLSVVGIPNLGTYNQALYALRRTRLETFMKTERVEVAGRDVLELGCGNGYWTRFFAEKGVRSYTGVDIAFSAIESLRTVYPQYTFHCMDIGRSPSALAALGRFDNVVAFDVLFHILEDTEWAAALSVARASLRPNGTFIFSEHLGPTTFYANKLKARSRPTYLQALETSRLAIRAALPIFFLSHAPTRLPQLLQPLGRLYWRTLSFCLKKVAGVGWIARHTMPFIDRVIGLARPRWGPSTHFFLAISRPEELTPVPAPANQ